MDFALTLTIDDDLPGIFGHKFTYEAVGNCSRS